MHFRCSVHSIFIVTFSDNNLCFLLYVSIYCCFAFLNHFYTPLLISGLYHQSSDSSMPLLCYFSFLSLPFWFNVYYRIGHQSNSQWWLSEVVTRYIFGKPIESENIESQYNYGHDSRGITMKRHLGYK